MMRFTILALAFLLIIEALEEQRILVYAYEGRDAGHKSIEYHGDQDKSILNPKELYDYTTNTGVPRKLRFGKTKRAENKEQVTAMSYDNWSIKISDAPKHLMVERKLGFHKRREHKKTNILEDQDNKSKKMIIIVDDLTNHNNPPKLEPSSSAKEIKKLARLLRNDYPNHTKPRRKPPVNNKAPDKT